VLLNPINEQETLKMAYGNSKMKGYGKRSKMSYGKMNYGSKKVPGQNQSKEAIAAYRKGVETLGNNGY
jgi:hypothetical protein